MGDRPDITIPEEAIEQAAMPLAQYMARVDTYDAASDALRVAAPLIVAAGFESLADSRYMRRDQDGDWVSLAYIRSRAAELRGGAK